MTHFEYLTTFKSFLYAIMVGRIITTLAGLSWKQLTWQHVGWLVILLINLVQAWWKMWSGHDSVWSYGFFIISMAHVIPMMYAVVVLTPAKDPADWAEYLAANRVKFFVAYAVFWVAIGVSNYLGGANWGGTIVPFLLMALGASTANRFVQNGLIVFFAIVFVLIGISMSRV